MRGLLLQMLGVVGGLASVAACAPATQPQTPPPSYSPPTPPAHRFAASRARVVVVDARPKSARPGSDPALDDTADPFALAPAPLTTDELAKRLDARLKPTLESDGDELVFTVSVVEARALDENAESVRATVDISVAAAGRPLVTTRGVSTLVGWVSQGPVTHERIEGAIVDAFERGILRESFVQATNTALVDRQRSSTPSSIPPEQRSWRIEGHGASAKAHVLGAAIDAGDTYSLGARYLHDHTGDGHWAGYGGEVRLISSDLDRVDALAGLGVVRAGMGAEQVFSVELGLGPGGREHVRAMGIAGVYLSLYYVDLGFTGQFAINPTDEHRQLTGAHFGVRVSVPIDVHDIQVHCRSPMPCEASILPAWSVSPDDATAR